MEKGSRNVKFRTDPVPNLREAKAVSVTADNNRYYFETDLGKEYQALQNDVERLMAEVSECEAAYERCQAACEVECDKLYAVVAEARQRKETIDEAIWEKLNPNPEARQSVSVLRDVLSEEDRQELAKMEAYRRYCEIRLNNSASAYDNEEIPAHLKWERKAADSNLRNAKKKLGEATRTRDALAAVIAREEAPVPVAEKAVT